MLERGWKGGQVLPWPFLELTHWRWDVNCAGSQETWVLGDLGFARLDKSLSHLEPLLLSERIIRYTLGWYIGREGQIWGTLKIYVPKNSPTLASPFWCLGSSSGVVGPVVLRAAPEHPSCPAAGLSTDLSLPAGSSYTGMFANNTISG